MKKIFTIISLLIITNAIANAQQQVHKSIMQYQLQYYDSLEKIGKLKIKQPKPKAKSNIYANCHLNKRVYGWYPYWQGNTYQNFEWSLISDFVYFAYEVDPSTGNAVSTHGWETSAAVDEALNQGVNVSLCVTLFSNHSTFLNSSTARQNLINNLINLVQQRGAHGINIDFEGVSSSLKTQFNDFLVQIADAFHSQIPGSEVTVALYAVDWNDVFDEALLNNHIDLFIIMGYDYYYSGSSTAGPTDPLYPFTSGSALNLSNTINYYLNEGISPNKLLLGLPYYGFDYPTGSSSLYASTTGSGSAKTFTVVKDNANGYYSSTNNHFDINSYSNYYVYNNGNWHQCFINNQETMEQRLAVANEYNIGGIGIWALGYDDGYMDYWNAIAQRFTDCSTICNGIVYDNGGPTRNYYDNSDYSFVIHPTQNALGLQISFSEFDLESGYDSLWIYDGNSTNAPLLLAASGNSIPSTIITSTPWALVKFHSDNATTGSGWTFQWQCLQDNIPPTADISAPDWTHNTFNSQWTESDNNGINDKYYLYAYKNPDNIWKTYSDSGMFFDDFEYSTLNNNDAWISSVGNWHTNNGQLVQSDENSSNTNIYTPLHTTGKLLIDWDMKIGGVGTNRRGGLHFLVNDTSADNRGDSYFVYFRVDQNKVQIYKCTANGDYFLETDDDCNINENTWYNYKLTYDPTTGTIKVYQNNILVSQWTDSNPLQSGDYLSLRTGNANVVYDNIRVYAERTFSNKYFTVGPGQMVPFENTSPQSPALLLSNIVVDEFGNFSDIADHFVNIDFSAPVMTSPVRDGAGADIDTLYDNTFISANWQSATDYNDSIDSYVISVGTQPFSNNIIDWTNVGNATIFDTAISLNYGTTYYTSLYSINKAGLISDTICSDGVTPYNSNHPPIANFTVSDSIICVGDTIHFTSNSQFVAGYLWLFEGGTPNYSISASPYVVYNTQGFYDVVLIVSNQSGSDTLKKENFIYVEGKPIADFHADQTTGEQPLTVTFTNTSSNSYYYNWKFGDGNISTEENPVHTYNVIGDYDVMLIASNNSCPSDTLIKNSYIHITTDISEQDFNKFKIYPIPAHNIINVSSTYFINKIVIYTINGKTVIQKQHIEKKNVKINIATLSKGNYIIKVFLSNKKEVTRHVIKE